MMDSRVLYRHGGAGLSPAVALALFCQRFAEMGRRRNEDGCEIEGTGPEDWGIPDAMLRPLRDLHILHCRLLDERFQAEAVFSWAADNPELPCPVAATQWLELVTAVNSRIIEFIRELARWMEAVKADAGAQDAASVAIVSGNASIERDGEVLRIVAA